MEKSFDDRIGMTLVEKGEILVEDIVLKEEKEYQREVKPAKLAKLRTSVEKYGYLEDKRIVLNPADEPVEGQHRVIILRENGVTKVDFIRYRYDTPEDEWKHFNMLNNWDPTLASKDDWHGKFGGGNPLAKILYRLNSDDTSILYGKIHLRGSEGKWKFHIPQALLVINYTLGIYRMWSREREIVTYDKLAHFTYNNIRQAVNSVLGWFNDVFGLPSETTLIPYKATIFRALLRFYRQLDLQHKLQTTKSREATIKRLKKFNFSEPTFLKADEFTKLVNLVAFYNHAKRKGDQLQIRD